MLLISYVGICQKKLWSNCHSSQPFFCSYHSIKSQSLIPLVWCALSYGTGSCLYFWNNWRTTVCQRLTQCHQSSVPDFITSVMASNSWIISHKDFLFVAWGIIYLHLLSQEVSSLISFMKEFQNIMDSEFSALADCFLRWFIYL
jgi:hypothetical protein